MKLLYPEETNLPLMRVICLWLYRFTLIAVPRLLLIATPFLVILRAAGVLHISWWWVFTPALTVLAPLLLMCMIVACGSAIAAKHEKMQCAMGSSGNRAKVDIYRHNATGQYYIIEKSSEGEILGGFSPDVPQYMIEDLLTDSEAYEELKTRLANFCGTYPKRETPDDLREWLINEEFTLCDPTRVAQEDRKPQRTPEDERLADIARRYDQQPRPHFGCFDPVRRPR